MTVVLSMFTNQCSKEPHKMVLVLYIGIVLYAYICRWGEHQGVAEELKGCPQGGPFLLMNHTSPTGLSVVSLLQWMNYFSHTHICVCDHRADYLCMYLGFFFLFSNFSIKFTLSYLISWFTFYFKGLDNDNCYRWI